MRSRYIHKRILAYLSDCKLHTIQEIAEEIEVSYITVFRHIQDIPGEMITTYHGGGRKRGGVQLLRTDKFHQIFDSQEAGLLLEGLKERVGRARVTSLIFDMEKTGKPIRDWLANTVNHPTDFCVRIYAQVILQTLLGIDFTTK